MVISDQVYNPVSLFYIIGDPGWLTLCAAGYYAVDVFFFIGGFLSCVVILEKFEKSKRLSP
jgi:peptidoglycan/LPS O-acetylase OafA/YrhL